MSKDTASALKDKGQQHKIDIRPSMEAQADVLRAADQAAAAARDVLQRAQEGSAAAEADAAAQRASMDSLIGRDSALDQAIRNASNAAHIFAAAELLRRQALEAVCADMDAHQDTPAGVAP